MTKAAASQKWTWMMDSFWENLLKLCTNRYRYQNSEATGIPLWIQSSNNRLPLISIEKRIKSNQIPDELIVCARKCDWLVSINLWPMASSRRTYFPQWHVPSSAGSPFIHHENRFSDDFPANKKRVIRQFPRWIGTASKHRWCRFLWQIMICE